MVPDRQSPAGPKPVGRGLAGMRFRMSARVFELLTASILNDLLRSAKIRGLGTMVVNSSQLFKTHKTVTVVWSAMRKEREVVSCSRADLRWMTPVRAYPPGVNTQARRPNAEPAIAPTDCGCRVVLSVLSVAGRAEMRPSTEGVS